MKNLIIIILIVSRVSAGLEDQLLHIIKQAGLLDAQKALTSEVKTPLMKELSCTIQSAWCKAKQTKLLPEPVKSSFLLKNILPIITKDQPPWDTLSPSKKNERYAAALKTLLETNPMVVKEALMENADPEAKAFISTLESLTDQTYLSRVFGQQPALMKQLFICTNKGIALRPHLMKDLTRANLTVAPLAVLKEIAQSPHVLQSHILQLDDTTLHWWFPEGMPSQSIEQAARCIAVLYSVRSWFKSPGLAKKRFLSWYFALTPVRKYFPKPGGTFTIEHLNSAELLPEGTVYFREEELLKNSVHEFFHGIRLEDGINPATSSILQKRYAIEKPDAILLSEAYVEAAATLVHTLLEAAETVCPEQFLQEYGRLWAIEKSFALYQAAKMLAISGFSSLGEFLAPTKTKKRIRETTAAAEYYILKTALLFNPEKFIKIMHSPIDTQKDKQKELLALIDTTLHDPTFTHWVNSLLFEISHAPRTTELFKTGRVTLPEPCTVPAIAD